MLKGKNIIVKHEGKYIRIGVSKVTGKTYMQPKENNKCPDLWFRFEPEYYVDYEDYLNEYYDYTNEDEVCPNLRYCKILDGETLNHYISLFDAKEVYINDQCVYLTNCDVRYTKEKYIEDMEKHMIPNKYYPFINNVNISVDDTTKDVTIHFTVTIQYEV